MPKFPDQASTFAASVDTIFLVLIGLACVFALIVFTAIVVLGIRYRRGSNVDRSNPPTSNLKLEALWIGVPLVLALGMFGWAATTYFHIDNPPSNALEIYVVGKQWMWKFEHPEGQTEISDLHIPMGRPVKLTMISQDVIHSFFIPAFRVKQDVLPGRYTSLWFEATQTGTFDLYCTQYCGVDHAVMGGRIIVLTAADYERWLNGDLNNDKSAAGVNNGSNGNNGGGPMTSTGAQLFESLRCSSCHRSDGAGRGPSLVGVYGSIVTLADGSTITADDSYLRESIVDPARKVVAGYQPIMPSYQGQISEEQLVQLLAFLKSSGSPSPDSTAPAKDRGVLL